MIVIIHRKDQLLNVRKIDGNVFPSDMFFHHHPSKAMAFALAGDHQSAPVSNGGPELRQGQGM